MIAQLLATRYPDRVRSLASIMSTTGDPSVGELLRGHVDASQLDAQIGYQFTDNLGVTLEAINITEEDQSEYLQFENLPFTFESGTRRILFGIRGNF